MGSFHSTQLTDTSGFPPDLHKGGVVGLIARYVEVAVTQTSDQEHKEQNGNA